MDESKVSLDLLIGSFPTFDGKKNKNIDNFIHDYNTFATTVKIPENPETFGRFLVLTNRRMITVWATIKIYVPFCAITLHWLTRNNSIRAMTLSTGIT